MKKYIIVIPIGDPAGVGPEIVVKAVVDSVVQSMAICLVIGERQILEDAMCFSHMSLTVNEIEDPEQCIDQQGVMNLINLKNIDLSKHQMGKVSGMCGQAAYSYIEKSVELVMNNQVDAVATTPINKESLNAGKINFIGQTEIFAELTSIKDLFTMFEVHGMRVFSLSRHVSLHKACELVKRDSRDSWPKSA